MKDLVNKIIQYEDGEMENNEVLELFSELVKNGMAWTLQGSYGRMAQALITSKHLDSQGNIVKRFDE